MALETIGCCPPETTRTVAFVTFHSLVSTDERETRLVVID